MTKQIEHTWPIRRFIPVRYSSLPLSMQRRLIKLQDSKSTITHCECFSHRAEVSSPISAHRVARGTKANADFARHAQAKQGLGQYGEEFAICEHAHQPLKQLSRPFRVDADATLLQGNLAPLNEIWNKFQIQDHLRRTTSKRKRLRWDRNLI